MRKGDAFAHRNAAIAACRRLGRKLWKNWSGYHRRSLVETKMHCIKRLGERVMSRTFERQVNELHIRAAILNRFTELGCPQTVAHTRLGLGKSGLGLIYATALAYGRNGPRSTSADSGSSAELGIELRSSKVPTDSKIKKARYHQVAGFPYKYW
jgi:hypothetical protein